MKEVNVHICMAAQKYRAYAKKLVLLRYEGKGY
jgi:hypothetical protein